MKNVHKIRGKREFLFDDRELLVLGTGAAIICVLIFILGFLVGQGVEQNTMAETLDVAEEPMVNEELAMLESAVSESRLTESTAQGTAETAAQKKSGGSSYRVLPEQTEEYVQVDLTPVSESVPETQGSQPEEESTATTIAEEVAQEPATQPAVMEGSVGEQNVVVPALPNVPKSPTDEIRVGRPSYEVSEGMSGLSGPLFSVQVSSSPNYEDSERLQQKYIALGYEAYVMTADLGDKGIWYRVRIGNLASKEDAEYLRQDILSRASHLAKDPFIIKVDE